MIENKDFEKLRKALAESYETRERAISKSRELVSLSKKVIYSVQRNDLKAAEDALNSLRKHKKEMDLLKCEESAYRIAMQEFVEALTFYEFIKNGKLTTSSQAGVDAESYLLGVCDLTGELVRKAVNAAINGKYDESLKIKEFVSELYGELMLFDFRNSELRRKFDGIKYDLKKLEDLALQIRLKK